MALATIPMSSGPAFRAHPLLLLFQQPSLHSDDFHAVKIIQYFLVMGPLVHTEVLYPLAGEFRAESAGAHLMFTATGSDFTSLPGTCSTAAAGTLIVFAGKATQLRIAFFLFPEQNTAACPTIQSTTGKVSIHIVSLKLWSSETTLP